MVTGRKAIADDTGRPLDETESLYWRYESQIKAWESATGSVTGVAGEILAFRREAYPELETGTLNDDFVQAMTAAARGWRVAYAPGAISLERASATIEDEAVRRARLVTGRLQALGHVLAPLAARDPQLAWQVVSHKGMRPLVPGLLLVALLSSASLGRRRRLGTDAIVAGQVAFAGAALAGWRGERSGRRHRLTYLPYYFVRMNVATVRGHPRLRGWPARGRLAARGARLTASRRPRSRRLAWITARMSTRRMRFSGMQLGVLRPTPSALTSRPCRRTRA